MHFRCVHEPRLESFALQCFKRGNEVELSNGIMFNFYPVLPHMLQATVRLWCVPILSHSRYKIILIEVRLEFLESA